MADQAQAHYRAKAAQFARAGALRALYHYREARQSAAGIDPGAGLKLVEPPRDDDLAVAYVEALEQALSEDIDSAVQAEAAVKLLARIVSDLARNEILDQSAPVPRAREPGDALRIIAALAQWVKDVNVTDAVCIELGERPSGRMP